MRLGTKLDVAYFDQLRAQLDPERTLVDTISPGSEWVKLADGDRHVLTYLSDFLFPPERANAPVRTLSGGERNRLLLARLFAQPANLLVLDEPTNDLDIESLELLEATLQSYSGTLLLVSHDRTFLDNVVTQTLVAEGPDGTWKEYVGGYSDWVAQRPAATSAGAQAAPAGAGAQPAATSAVRRGARRAARQSSRSRNSANWNRCRPKSKRSSASSSTSRTACPRPTITSKGPTRCESDRERAAEIEHLLAKKFERWAELDAKAAASGLAKLRASAD